jgi:oxaloacetate decarboxylase alpha subunit
MEDKVLDFVDQTIRDAQQSLWGFRMPTDMILPIAPVMDQVGYRAIGVVGGRGAVVAVRYLKEDIFDRYRRLRQRIKKTPLRSSFMVFDAFGFGVEPMAAIELWIRRSVANGVRSFWINDYQNLMDRLAYLLGVTKQVGAEVVVCLGYTLSPVHTDELFAKKVRKLVGLGCVDRIHIEDPGLMTPERARTLIPAIQQASNGIPIEFHSHCNLGLGGQNYVEALKLGIKTLHTAVSPLANDTSLPSIENTISNARHLGYSIDADEEAIKTISDYFRTEAEKRGMRTGVPLEYDLGKFEHQVPGGMMGTLRNQLVELKQEHRMKELLEEVSRVRAELGYAIMGTPYSQVVGAQALFNVTSGERYKDVSDELIMYMLGIFGEPDGPIDQDIKDKVLASQEGKRWLNWKAPEITIDDLRKLEPELSDDELLLRLMNPDKGLRYKLDILYGRR